MRSLSNFVEIRKKKENYEEENRLLRAGFPQSVKKASQSLPRQAAKNHHFRPRPIMRSPRGIAAVVAAKNMPPAHFLNAATWTKILLAPQTCELTAIVGIGAPARAQRSGSRGERRRSAMSELSASAGSEGYVACGDEVRCSGAPFVENPTSFLTG